MGGLNFDRSKRVNKKILKNLINTRDVEITSIEIEFEVIDDNGITDSHRIRGFADRKASDHFKVTLFCKKKKAKLKKKAKKAL